MVVLKDGELVAERYAEGFGPATPQLGWSMTKSVTDLLVGRLVQQGKVSLDDDHLRPEWAVTRRAAITVRQLLQMTSGLAWDETYALNTPITRMLYLEPDMGAYVAAAAARARSGDLPAVLLRQHHPALLGAGDPHRPRREPAPSILLFAPLGLSSAVLEPDAAGTPVCSSYMWATPRDWAAVGQFALDDGVWNGERLLPAGWMAESTRAVDVTNAETDPYASGWWPNRRRTARSSRPGCRRTPTSPRGTTGSGRRGAVRAPGHGAARLHPHGSVDTRVLSGAAGMVRALR